MHGIIPEAWSREGTAIEKGRIDHIHLVITRGERLEYDRVVEEVDGQGAQCEAHPQAGAPSVDTEEIAYAEDANVQPALTRVRSITLSAGGCRETLDAIV